MGRLFHGYSSTLLAICNNRKCQTQDHCQFLYILLSFSTINGYKDMRPTHPAMDWGGSVGVACPWGFMYFPIPEWKAFNGFSDDELWRQADRHTNESPNQNGKKHCLSHYHSLSLSDTYTSFFFGPLSLSLFWHEKADATLDSTLLLVVAAAFSSWSFFSSSSRSWVEFWLPTNINP